MVGMARAGTPTAMVQRLNQEISAVMALPRNMSRFGDLGFQFVNQSPADFQKLDPTKQQRAGVHPVAGCVRASPDRQTKV